MAKSKLRSTPPKTGREVKRNPASDRFVIGRGAFGKVSEVEGILVSRGLESELRRLKNARPEERRAALAQKYGKR